MTVTPPGTPLTVANVTLTAATASIVYTDGLTRWSPPTSTRPRRRTPVPFTISDKDANNNPVPP